jgi:hypothetical protein
MTKKNNPQEGGDALIHLRVPAATKARWVRESRAAGQKLSTWIIDRVEARKMNVFPIPEALASKYHGAGYALAAVLEGSVIDLVYLREALPDFGEERQDALAAIDDPRIAPTVRRLQALGQVSIGMCSGWEFVEL